MSQNYVENRKMRDNYYHHLLLDAVREILCHPGLNSGDADLHWIRQIGASLYASGVPIVQLQLNGGRLDEIRKRLGILPSSARAMTSAEFMEMAQELLSRPSYWTEDEAWVLQTLRDVARVRPGHHVPQVVADHMRLICSPAPPAPSRRDPLTNLSAKFRSQDPEVAYWHFDARRRKNGSERGAFKSVLRELFAGGLTDPPRPVPPPEPSTRSLDAWLGILRENREWRGVEPGSTSFGPIREPPVPRFRPAQPGELVDGQEVFVRDGSSMRKIRVAIRPGHPGQPPRLGYVHYIDGLRVFSKLDCEVFVEVPAPPPGYRVADLEELCVGDEVLVLAGSEYTTVHVVEWRLAEGPQLGHEFGTAEHRTFQKFAPGTIYIKAEG